MKLQDAGFDPSIQTVFIDNVQNNAQLINPLLAIQLQEGLKQKIADESPLSVINEEGDQNFYITIQQYQISAIAPAAGEVSNRNRLTIGIQVESVISASTENNWTQSFSRFAEFNAAQSINSVEDQLVQTIILQLTDDIYRKAFVNW